MDRHGAKSSRWRKLELEFNRIQSRQSVESICVLEVKCADVCVNACLCAAKKQPQAAVLMNARWEESVLAFARN